MNTIRSIATAGAFAAALFASTAEAQDGAGPVPASGAAGLNVDLTTLMKAKAGAWADYTMSGKGTDKAVTIRYAVVERTPSKVSLEVDTPSPKGELVVRFDFVPQGPDTWKIQSGKVQLGGQKIDVPPAQLAAATPLKTTDPPGELVGTEELTTPLGSFSSKHYKKSLTEGGKGPWMDVWINPSISPTGLVKSSFEAMGIQVTLLATGTGAQSKIQ
jgi:hypothetical protein